MSDHDPGTHSDMVEHGHDQHEGHPHGHEAHEAMGVVALAELADALLDDLPNHAAGRAAKTILSGTVMRATMIALGEGEEMAEHDSPPAATVYVVKGDVTLRSGSRSWRLTAGQLAPIPPERHGVVAHADSAILLTVALR